MEILHLRNATAILTLGEHRLLLDPMLAEVGALPNFKQFGEGKRHNPTVPLPPETAAALEGVTGVLVTHEHPDHFDASALAWVRERGLPVYTHAVDAPNLRAKGLEVCELEDGALGMEVEVVPARHGRGLIAWLMGPVCGFYLAHPDEPSLYITSDAVLTPALLAAVERLQPDLILAPAGAANFGAGGDILFSVDELVELGRRSTGQLVFNHLEALDHCPTTRALLRERMDAAGLGPRVHIPADGEALAFTRDSARARARVGPSPALRPGLQKWVTARFAGT